MLTTQLRGLALAVLLISIPAGLTAQPNPRADVNCDGHIDGLDIAKVRAPGNWSTLWPNDPRADVDWDGQTTGLDIAVIRQVNNWGKFSGLTSETCNQSRFSIDPSPVDLLEEVTLTAHAQYSQALAFFWAITGPNCPADNTYQCGSFYGPEWSFIPGPNSDVITAPGIYGADLMIFALDGSLVYGGSQTFEVVGGCLTSDDCASGEYCTWSGQCATLPAEFANTPNCIPVKYENLDYHNHINIVVAGLDYHRVTPFNNDGTMGLDKFKGDSHRITKDLLSIEPFHDFDRINIFRVDTVPDQVQCSRTCVDSDTADCDLIDCSSPDHPDFNESACRAVNCIPQGDIKPFLATQCPSSLVWGTNPFNKATWFLLIINDDYYGGLASGAYTYTTRHLEAPLIAQHETLGHGVGYLADEYVSNAVAGGSASRRNCNLSAQCDQNFGWSDLMNDPLFPEVGCFKGCDRGGTGIFRGTQTSLMRELAPNLPFYSVNERLLCCRFIKKAYTPIDGLPSRCGAFDIPPLDLADFCANGLAEREHLIAPDSTLYQVVEAKDGLYQIAPLEEEYDPHQLLEVSVESLPVNVYGANGAQLSPSAAYKVLARVPLLPPSLSAKGGQFEGHAYIETGQPEYLLALPKEEPLLVETKARSPQPSQCGAEHVTAGAPSSGRLAQLGINGTKPDLSYPALAEPMPFGCYDNSNNFRPPLPCEKIKMMCPATFIGDYYDEPADTCPDGSEKVPVCRPLCDDPGRDGLPRTADDEACCGGWCYFPNPSGSIFGSEMSCCGDPVLSGRPYHIDTHQCCNAKIHRKKAAHECCGQDYYRPSGKNQQDPADDLKCCPNDLSDTPPMVINHAACCEYTILVVEGRGMEMTVYPGSCVIDMSPEAASHLALTDGDRFDIGQLNAYFNHHTRTGAIDRYQISFLHELYHILKQINKGRYNEYLPQLELEANKYHLQMLKRYRERKAGDCEPYPPDNCPNPDTDECCGISRNQGNKERTVDFLDCLVDEGTTTSCSTCLPELDGSSSEFRDVACHWYCKDTGGGQDNCPL